MTGYITVKLIWFVFGETTAGAFKKPWFVRFFKLK